MPGGLCREGVLPCSPGETPSVETVPRNPPRGGRTGGFKTGSPWAVTGGGDQPSHGPPDQGDLRQNPGRTDQHQRTGKTRTPGDRTADWSCRGGEVTDSGTHPGVG